MSSFAAWGLTILGIAMVSTVAEMLLPQGKTRKVVRSVFATVAALTVITPLPMLIKNGINFDFTSDAVHTDGSYIDYVGSVKEKLVAESLHEHLKANGYDVEVEVKLDGAWNAVSATINFEGLGITENIGHINKKEVIKLVAEFLNIGEEAVRTYG